MSAATRSWILVVASIGGVALVATLIGSLTEPPAESPLTQAPSAFSSEERGARALFLIAQELLPSVQLWRKPLTHLTEADATLIVAGPSEHLSPAEADALDEWVSSGGQLLLMVDKDWEVREEKEAFLARHGLRVEGAAFAEKAVHPVRVPWESSEPLRLRLSKGCAVRGEGTEVARVEDDVVVMARAQGRGRIVVVPDAFLGCNDSLPDSDNAALVIALCSQRNARVVLFDEYHHGFGESRDLYALSAELMTTPWGWMLATAAAAGGIYVFGCRRRFGRIVEPAEPSRQSPMETVDARAGLFRVAQATTLAIDLFCSDLEQSLGLSLGRAVDLEALARGLRADASSRCVGEVDRLVALRDRARRGRSHVAESDVVDAGKLAGRILKEMSLE